MLHEGVSRRWNAVHSGKHDDFAVEVVGLDVAGPSVQALPGRPTRPGRIADRADTKEVTATPAVLVSGRGIQPGGLQDGFSFVQQQPAELPAASGRPADSLDLSVLGCHPRQVGGRAFLHRLIG